jgi:putative ABC transport system substrate-binding protein
MRRREFMAGLGSAAAALPAVVRAQQPAIPVIGFLHNATLEAISPTLIAAFRAGLAELGYVEGQNVVIAYRWAEGRNDRLPALAADLVRRRVAVITGANSTTTALAAKAATSTIPIVFLVGVDSVKTGLVASLNRPGGNLTGVSSFTGDLTTKRLQLLHEFLPRATSIALLLNPSNPVAAEAQKRDAELAAQALGVHLSIVAASDASKIETAFRSLVERGSGALLLGDDATFNAQRDQIVALAAHHAVPAIYAVREYTVAGGLMSYGTSRVDAWRLVGSYTGRILKGEKPADLPIVQPTKFELVINLKAAKALGLTIPETLLATADEVIQ